MRKDSKIYVAGHNGMVGSAIVRKLKAEGYTRILGISSRDLDLRNQLAVEHFFELEQPDIVFLAAAKVGGIHANNSYPADFIRDNILIQTNLIHQSYKYKVKKLMFLGSSCIYPRACPQPIKEEYLLTGTLEPTNEAYAVAKISGIIMCQSYNRQYGTNFISVMPTNLYGPSDNYDLSNSHVLPALVRKFHEAKQANKPFVEVWGSGKPRREFLYVDDLAQACFFLMKEYNKSEIVNIGTGIDITIADLALLIKDIIGFKGDIRYDSSKPDGMPVKRLEVSRINKLGWKASTTLRDGIALAYKDFVAHGVRPVI